MTTDRQPPVDEDRLKAVFRALSDHGVDYVVFGAVALGLHGLARDTVRQVDRFDASLLAEKFGFEEG